MKAPTPGEFHQSAANALNKFMFGVENPTYNVGFLARTAANQWIAQLSVRVYSSMKTRHKHEAARFAKTTEEVYQRMREFEDNHSRARYDVSIVKKFVCKTAVTFINLQRTGWISQKADIAKLGEILELIRQPLGLSPEGKTETRALSPSPSYVVTDPLLLLQGCRRPSSIVCGQWRRSRNVKR